MPYTSLNGNMFSYLDKDGNLGLRLPKEIREDFIKKYKTTLCEAHGSVLKEYVLVPITLFSNIDELKNYFSLSYDYTKTLKLTRNKYPKHYRIQSLLDIPLKNYFPLLA